MSEELEKIEKAEAPIEAPEEGDDLHLTFGFSTTNSLISRIIKWFTRSKVSHTWIAFDFIGIRLYIGADERGLSFFSAWRFKKENKIMAEFKPGKNLKDSLSWFLLTYAGTDYDYGAAGAIGIMNRLTGLWKRFSGWLYKKLTNKNKLICTEVLVRLAQHAELPGFEELDPETTDAQVLLLHCKKHCEAVFISSELKLDLSTGKPT